MTASKTRFIPRNPAPKEVLQKRDHYKLAFIAAGAAIIAGVIAVFAGASYTKITDSHDQNTVNNHTTIARDSTQRTSLPQQQRTSTQNKTVAASTSFIPPSKKAAFFGIRTSGDGPAYDLNGKLKEIFSARGYEPREAATGKGFENLVIATFHVAEARGQKGIDHSSTIIYPLELVLEFYQGPAPAPCERRTYAKNIYGNKLDDKQEIIAQGVRELLALVAAEQSFPLCIPKH